MFCPGPGIHIERMKFGICLKTFQNSRKLGEGVDSGRIVLHISETVRCKNERDSGSGCGGSVALGVSDINRMLKMVSLDYDLNIFCLIPAGVTGTGKVFKIRTKPCSFQKNFNISGFAVAYDE